MAIGDFNKKKQLDVASVSGTPTISHAVPIKITSGDDSNTGTGEIVLDWTNISSKSDIGVYDESGNLLDYYFESFDATGSTAIIHVYRDWVQDGTTQCQVAYGSGPSDQSVSASTVFDKEDTNSNLVSGWLLNESSGDALDVTSNNNDGTVNGATQGVTGQVNGAISLDGNDDTVDAGIIDTVSNNEITLSVWIKSDWSSMSDYSQIMGAWGSDPSYYLQARPDGDIRMRVADSGGSDVFATSSAANYDDNNWHHIVGTYDGTTVELYIDGTSVASNDNSLTFDYDTDDPFQLAQTGFYGLMDDARTYDRALSSDEISAKFSASKSTPDFFSQQAAETTATDVTYNATAQTVSVSVSGATVETSDVIVNMYAMKVKTEIEVPLINDTRISGASGEKAIERDWPNEEGRIAKITKQEGRDLHLRPQLDLKKNKKEKEKGL